MFNSECKGSDDVGVKKGLLLLLVGAFGAQY